MQVLEGTREIREAVLVSTPVQVATATTDDVDEELCGLHTLHWVEVLAIDQCHTATRITEVPAQAVPPRIHVATTTSDMSVAAAEVRVVKMLATGLDHLRRWVEEVRAGNFLIRTQIHGAHRAFEFVEHIRPTTRFIQYQPSRALPYFDG